jgi:hypothetical protein
MEGGTSRCRKSVLAESVAWLDFGSYDHGWLQLDVIAAPPGYINTIRSGLWQIPVCPPPVQQPAMPKAILKAERVVGVSTDETVFFSIT